MNRFLDCSKALCLSPHPDDVEYSMGGSIRKYRDTFFDVICLSQGGDCDQTSNLARIEESRDFWARHRCDNVAVHSAGVEHVKNLDDDLWINLLERKFLNGNDYGVIFTTSSSDSHFEHRLVNRLAPPLSRLEKISLIEYCSPSTLDDWIPNLFVDIAGEFDSKLASLGAFSSQKSRKYFTEDTIRNFNTNFRCSKRGLRYVEQFRIVQIYE